MRDQGPATSAVSIRTIFSIPLFNVPGLND
jgi:hypothetical protein